MKYEYAKIDGISNIFASPEDILVGNIKPELAEYIDSNSIVFITCLDEDVTTFGGQFEAGSMWVWTHGVLVGDSGTYATMSGYTTKGETDDFIKESDSIQEAFSKVENKIVQLNSSTDGSDWYIIQ